MKKKNVTAEKPIGGVETITEDRWWEFKPVKNRLLKGTHAWDNCMFETHGRELKIIKGVVKNRPLGVWTLIETDGIQTIVSGFHTINRIGYFVTEIPVADGVRVDVVLDHKMPITESEDALRRACGIFLCDSNISLLEQYELLVKENENDITTDPDGVIRWHPFENFTIHDLLEQIELQRDSFLEFLNTHK